MVHCSKFLGVDVLTELTQTAEEAVRRRGIKGKRAIQSELDIVSTFRGRLRSFASGTVPRGPSEDCYESVVSQPDLWEVRFRVRGIGKFRSYHGETDGVPGVVVTRVHQKVDTGDHDADSSAQTQVMAEAQERFTGGRRYEWGHRRTDCATCL